MQTSRQTLTKVKEVFLNDIKNNCKELQFFMDHLKASDLFEHKTKGTLLHAIYYFTVIGQTYEAFVNMSHISSVTAYSKKYPIAFSSLIEKLSKFNDYINPELSYDEYIESVKNTDWYMAYSCSSNTDQLNINLINHYCKNIDIGIIVDLNETLRLIKLTMEN